MGCGCHLGKIKNWELRVIEEGNWAPKDLSDVEISLDQCHVMQTCLRFCGAAGV